MLALLAATVYVAYPYRVVCSLKQAVKEGQTAVLTKRVNYVALKKSLLLEIVQSLKIEDAVNSGPAPVIQTLNSEDFLRKGVEENLADADSFLRLLKPIESKDSASDESAASTPKLRVDRSRYGSLGYTFFTSPSEFCVTLKDVTLQFKALVDQYSPERPIELQATTPRLRLFFHLSNSTWQLERVELPYTASDAWLLRRGLIAINWPALGASRVTPSGNLR